VQKVLRSTNQDKKFPFFLTNMGFFANQQKLKADVISDSPQQPRKAKSYFSPLRDRTNGQRSVVLETSPLSSNRKPTEDRKYTEGVSPALQTRRHLRTRNSDAAEEFYKPLPKKLFPGNAKGQSAEQGLCSISSPILLEHWQHHPETGAFASHLIVDETEVELTSEDGVHMQDSADQMLHSMASRLRDGSHRLERGLSRDELLLILNYTKISPSVSSQARADAFFILALQCTPENVESCKTLIALKIIQAVVETLKAPLSGTHDKSETVSELVEERAMVHAKIAAIRILSVLLDLNRDSDEPIEVFRNTGGLLALDAVIANELRFFENFEPPAAIQSRNNFGQSEQFSMQNVSWNPIKNWIHIAIILMRHPGQMRQGGLRILSKLSRSHVHRENICQEEIVASLMGSFGVGKIEATPSSEDNWFSEASAAAGILRRIADVVSDKTMARQYLVFVGSAIEKCSKREPITKTSKLISGLISTLAFLYFKLHKKVHDGAAGISILLDSTCIALDLLKQCLVCGLVDQTERLCSATIGLFTVLTMRCDFTSKAKVLAAIENGLSLVHSSGEYITDSLSSFGSKLRQLEKCLCVMELEAKRAPESERESFIGGSDLLNPKDFELKDILGRGASGTVHEAVDLVTGERLAVKQLRSRITQRMINERQVWRSLAHPNVVDYRGYFVDQQKGLNLVCEYVDGMSLAENLERFGAFSEAVASKITRQLLLALQHVHSKKIVHRDVKPANVLLSSGGVVKLTDFGVSSAHKAQSMVGTPHYCAPEVLDGEVYSDSVDIFSLGCTVLELVTGKRPFHEFGAVQALLQLRELRGIPLPVQLSPCCRNFISSCVEWDPENRPSADVLLRHPFIVANS